MNRKHTIDKTAIKEKKVGHGGGVANCSQSFSRAIHMSAEGSSRTVTQEKIIYKLEMSSKQARKLVWLYKS